MLVGGGDLYEIEPVLLRQGVATTRRDLVQRRLVARGVVPPGCASFGPIYNADHSCYDTRPRPMEAANVVLPTEITGMPSPSTLLVKVSADGLNSDLHAGAEYRAALIPVLAGRAVAKALG